MADRQYLSHFGVFAIISCSALPAGLAVAQQPLDIAPFARVVTSDPARKDGARSGRLEEFRAEDVFLTWQVPQQKDGTYLAHMFENARACVGLEWAERRMLTELSIQFSDAVQTPRPEDARIEYWSSAGRKDSWDGIGQTPWQGQWEQLPGTVEKQADRWTVHIDKTKVPEFADGVGTLKVRWVFDHAAAPITIKSLSAFSESITAASEFRLEMDPQAGRGPVTLEVYNGRFEDSPPGESPFSHSWDPARSLRIKLLHAIPKPAKADRTLIRFTLPAGGFSVAVEDLLANECIYVRDYGVFMARANVPTTLTQYHEKIAGRKTILQQVREAPDQTFEAAWKALRRPIQDNGPTMLSLPCDNAKFIVERDGTIRYGKFAVVPTFGNRRTKLDRLEWGQIGLDTAVVPPNAEKGVPMRIKDTTFQKGLGLHAHAQFSVELNGEYEAFESQVGVQWQDGSDRGTVIFQIEVDGRRVFDGGPMKQKDAARPVRIPLAGAQRVTLIADTGNSIECAAANWAEARLIRALSASEGPAATTQPAEEYLSESYTRDERTKFRRVRNLGPGDPSDGNDLAPSKVGFLPILWSMFQGERVSYLQMSYVGRGAQNQLALCVSSFSVEGEGNEQRSLCLDVFSDFDKRAPAVLQRSDEAILATEGKRVLAWLSPAPSKLDSFSVTDGTIRIRRDGNITVHIPTWNVTSEEGPPASGAVAAMSSMIEAWKGATGDPRSSRRIHVDVPEWLVDQAISATPVHILMAARTAPDGRSIEPWIASNTYGPLDTEAQAVILGMDLFGHHDFARRCHEFFISSYSKDGLLAKGYTLMGTGQHLWTLAEHVKLTGDTEWFKKVAPEVLRPCDWIKRQLEKTKRNDPAGVPLPESGLMPPGVLADWNRYAYYFYANAHFYAGLRGVAECLARIEHPRAAEIAKLADDYRDHILAAWKWQQARMPVLPLRDGTWVPATPSSLYCYGLTRDFYGGVSATGHDVEVGGNHLIPLGLIAPHSREAGWIADYYEDRWFLIDGIFGAYLAAENEADPFNRGGFAKLQPHYARTSDIHALRDDVKPFIRTYFNTFPVLLNTENLTFWEHMNNGGAWNKTHESGWFLQMTRTMLVQERGDELWLAPFVTNNWLRPGKGIKIQNAPTYFGPVSYELKPSADGNVIEAEITPPTRSTPKSVTLRIRHPEGKRFRRVLVNEAPWRDFHADQEVIRLAPSKTAIRVRVEY